jgi:histidinol dehydrogenase
VLCTPARADGRADARGARGRAAVRHRHRVQGRRRAGDRRAGLRHATIPKVAKIFGPGNRWVTAAKQLVAADADGAALDMPAGPSEVCVIADDIADADYVAADLLAQAEHDRSRRRSW